MTSARREDKHKPWTEDEACFCRLAWVRLGVSLNAVVVFFFGCGVPWGGFFLGGEGGVGRENTALVARLGRPGFLVVGVC